jgi:hypothetical protein
MWHREVVTADTQDILGKIAPALLPGSYLAGGTGLALHLGHRRSRDLDFFAPSLFDEGMLAQRFERLGETRLAAKAASTLHLTLEGVKISVFGYEYPLLFPPLPFESVDVADPRDIACMKISAIAARGLKRDFIDLYAVARQYPLAHLLELFHRKYAKAQVSGIHLRKSLVYFEDADRDPDPDLIQPLSWAAVKEYFVRETAG